MTVVMSILSLDYDPDGLPVLKTGRLILRPWQESDREPFAASNADPEVMRFFPRTLSREESNFIADRIIEKFSLTGYGLFAAELSATGQFLGYVGLWTADFSEPFTPCIEIGWRLAKEFWGKGYAPEGARACLGFGFNHKNLKEIFSFTSAVNTPSIRVMEKIGLRRDTSGDFDHPNLSPDSPLCRHVLYRLTAEEWKRQQYLFQK